MCGKFGGVLVVVMEICLCMATKEWNGNCIGRKRGEMMSLIEQAKMTLSYDT